MLSSLSFIRMGEGIVSKSSPRSSYLPRTTIKPLVAMKQGLCLRVMVCLREIKTGGVARGEGEKTSSFLHVSSLPVFFFARCCMKASFKRETARDATLACYHEPGRLLLRFGTFILKWLRSA